MNAIYLSGSGNTKHIVGLLLDELGNKGLMAPIESDEALKAIEGDELVIAYPTMFSNIPYLVRDFINSHQEAWNVRKHCRISNYQLIAFYSLQRFIRFYGRH